MKGLDRYKLDKAFTDGVVIRLDDAPDVEFLVRLPSQYNRGYTQTLYSSLNIEIGEDGTAKPTGGLMDAQYAQQDAFLSNCLLSIDGDPVPDTFMAEYPAAITEIISKATDLAKEIEESVGESVKKSPPSSNGSADGQGASSSTGDLKTVAG